MYTPRATRQFKRDRKTLRKRGVDLAELDRLLAKLAGGERLGLEYRPHKLQGEYRDCWECHLAGDWLLIWRIEDTTIVFVRTGSHADLFEQAGNVLHARWLYADVMRLATVEYSLITGEVILAATVLKEERQ